MLFGDEIEHRKVMFEAWRKHNASEELNALERQIVSIIEKHPEYHEIFNDPAQYLEKKFDPQTDHIHPILHIAMHQAVVDQITVNKPEGIIDIYQQLVKVLGDFHEVEHCIAHFLTQQIYAAIHDNQPFDNEKYLSDLRSVIDKGYWSVD
ncbi:MAG: DUF1841 family protein [Pseudomonadota bacterium]